ncbi:sodium- and chloride-dependent GABA transporter ine isoform X2 [Dunckerocampus dactyliophorus]|uniref:sodium- and chloride-dependent GABA transporter ine isoform X2 n=1 Tax=Dunckerocampus dactyliophorus TaxID=161453 RepID=UPI0024054428|nr:sodium- and chloride-dependent GABA transporter ine isoform X2 [Dunckerocampus dactyliophorus]
MMEAGNSTMNDEKNAALITSGEQVTPRETHVTRPTWSGRIEFILATVGYAVGLGNVWRFPYLCYSSGGGAFLIPYLTMLFLCGIPLLLMEFAIGQFTHLGPVHALAKVCPLLKGVGLATVVISYVFCTYYNVLMSWALFYLVNSFGATPPWKTCNNSWNVFENCSSGFPGNTTHLQSASQQFFDHRLLKKTDGIEDAGGLQWELFGYLFLAWVIVYLCIFKGVKSTGKVWVKAAAQVFNSLGIAFGSMISMASYNKFNNNIVRDALIVSFTNSFTSILAGFVIFSAIGYMAHIHNLPMDKISTDGPGLVFVVYPEVLSTMPAFQLWAPLFFFMLLCLGLDSQFATVEVALTFIKDEFGPQVLRFLKREELLALIVCIVSFLLGLPHVTKGGIYVFQLMDHYTAVVSLMFLAFFEVIAVCWFFGVPRICCIIERMLGKSVNFYFRICWFLLCPLLVLCILVSSIIQYTPVQYGPYKYPLWAEWVGWGVSLVSLIWIPIGAIHEICNNKGSFLSRLTTAMTTTVELDNEDPLPEKQNVADPLVETSTV